jgi:hypothetical protein
MDHPFAEIPGCPVSHVFFDVHDAVRDRETSKHSEPNSTTDISHVRNRNDELLAKCLTKTRDGQFGVSDVLYDFKAGDIVVLALGTSGAEVQNPSR